MSDSFFASHDLTRRELLKLLGTASAGTILSGSLSGCGPLWERQPAVEVDEWHKGVCRFCGTGCGVQVGTRDGEIVDVKGDEYAHNRGRLCIKGILNRDILNVDDRALHPLVRDDNGELQRASWEEAMGQTVSAFEEAIANHGPDSVAFYGSGQLYTQESYTANKLFKGAIGTNNVDGNPRLCMASAAAGYISTFGADEPMGCYEDVDHADCFFITGSNTAECHPIVWERVKDRKNAHPDTTIIVVDPRKTRTARHADLHLAITPGTDVALYNGMIRQFMEMGAIDEEMVEEYLTFKKGGGVEGRTYDDLKQHLSRYPLDRVSDICEVSVRDIREAAFQFADAGAAMSIWTMGLNQQAQGTACNRLVNAMHLLTGQIGRPGATPFSLTGQPNAGGGVRDTGSLAHALPGGRKVAKKKDRREMEELWELAPGSIDDTPGYPAVSMFEAMGTGDVQAAMVMCTNPAQSLPNAEQYREAMEDAFLVVTDAIHPTETTKFADVVLPAAMWAEKGPGIFSQSERRYHAVPKIVEPPGEARADLDILVDFATRLEHDDVISAQTYEDAWEEWRKISKHSYYDFSGMTMERLLEERGLLWPCPSEDHPGTCRRYVPDEDPLAEGDGRFDFYGRSDGKAVIWLEEQEPPSDKRTEEFPLVLTTGRVYEHWHTATITGALEHLDEIDIDFLAIHPADAQERGIADGDRVELESSRGAVELVAKVTSDIVSGVVFSTFHSPNHLVNRAVNDTVDPSSKQPEFKVSAVAVRPATGVAS
jgi:nitrate reductase NapA